MRTLYRGMDVIVPEGEDPTDAGVLLRVALHGRKLMSGQQETGLGRHWTVALDVAERFARPKAPHSVPGKVERRRGEWIEDEWYKGSRGTGVCILLEVETDAEHEKWVGNVLVPEEQEVTLRPGTPLHLVALSWWDGSSWRRTSMHMQVEASATTLTLYHGTLAKHVPAIRQQGLVPPVPTAKWYMLTSSFEQAARYTGGREDSVVLEFRVPEDKVWASGSESAVLWPGDPHDVYGFPATAYAVKGTLPPEYLVAVHPLATKTASADRKLYHGSFHFLGVGDVLEPGIVVGNWNNAGTVAASNVWMTDDPDDALSWAKQAAKERGIVALAYVYEVEPIGDLREWKAPDPHRLGIKHFTAPKARIVGVVGTKKTAARNAFYAFGEVDPRKLKRRIGEWVEREHSHDYYQGMKTQMADQGAIGRVILEWTDDKRWDIWDGNHRTWFAIELKWSTMPVMFTWFEGYTPDWSKLGISEPPVAGVVEWIKADWEAISRTGAKTALGRKMWRYMEVQVRIKPFLDDPAKTILAAIKEGPERSWANPNPRGGLGVHWTSDHHIARTFGAPTECFARSEWSNPARGPAVIRVPVVLEGRVSPGHVRSDPEVIGEYGMVQFDQRYDLPVTEQEVPVARDAPVFVEAVEVFMPSRKWLDEMVERIERTGYGERNDHATWTRYPVNLTMTAVKLPTTATEIIAGPWYHGTDLRNGADLLSRIKSQGPGRKVYGPGLYVTLDIEQAWDYGRYAVEVKINTDKLAVLKPREFYDDPLLPEGDWDMLYIPPRQAVIRNPAVVEIVEVHEPPEEPTWSVASKTASAYKGHDDGGFAWYVIAPDEDIDDHPIADKLKSEMAYLDAGGEHYRIVSFSNDSWACASVRQEDGFYKIVGKLTWFPGKPDYGNATVDGGIIHEVAVEASHQRRGLATAMLELARKNHPAQDIRHSTALTDDGKAWSQAVGSKTAEFDWSGWRINDKPYRPGTWIEVKPDAWVRHGDHEKGEIPSQMIAVLKDDKWAWEAMALTFIGAPHENRAGAQGPRKGTAKTLEEAQAKAEASLAKDHEFYRQYDERTKKKVPNWRSNNLQAEAAIEGLTFKHKEPKYGEGTVMAYLDGKHVAGAHYSLPLSFDPPNRLYISSIEVAAEHRRKGIATALMDYLLSLYPGMYLGSGDKLPDGRRWWPSLGDRLRSTSVKLQSEGRKMYHVAPVTARDDIAEHGLDWRRSGREGASGVFFNLDLAGANDMLAEGMDIPGAGPVDLYEVDVEGLILKADPYQPEDAVFTEQAVPASRVKLLRRFSKTAGWGTDHDEDINPAWMVEHRSPPAMTREQARAAGYTDGPYFHATDHAAAVRSQGFRQRAAEQWEIESYGEVEEFLKFDSPAEVWLGRSTGDVEGYGADIVEVWAKPGAVRSGDGMTLAGGSFVPRAEDIVPIMVESKTAITGVIPWRVRYQGPISLNQPRPVVLDPMAVRDFQKVLYGDEQKEAREAIEALERGKAKLEPKRGPLEGVWGIRVDEDCRLLVYPHIDGAWHAFYIGRHDYDQAEARWAHPADMPMNRAAALAPHGASFLTTEGTWLSVPSHSVDPATGNYHSYEPYLAETGSVRVRSEMYDTAVEFVRPLTKTQMDALLVEVYRMEWFSVQVDTADPGAEPPYHSIFDGVTNKDDEKEALLRRANSAARQNAARRKVVAFSGPAWLRETSDEDKARWAAPGSFLELDEEADEPRYGTTGRWFHGTWRQMPVGSILTGANQFGIANWNYGVNRDLEPWRALYVWLTPSTLSAAEWAEKAHHIYKRRHDIPIPMELPRVFVYEVEPLADVREGNGDFYTDRARIVREVTQIGNRRVGVSGAGRTSKTWPDLIRTWEQTKPWAASKEEVENGSVKGFAAGDARGTEAASFEDRWIILKPDYWTFPAESRRGVIYHEGGHALESALGLSGLTPLYAKVGIDPWAMPPTPALFHAGDPMGIVADGYSALWEDQGRSLPDWLRTLTVLAAKAAGFPIPDGVRVTAMPVKPFKGEDRNMSKRQVEQACQRILKDMAREFGYEDELPAIVFTDLQGTTGRFVEPQRHGRTEKPYIALDEEFWLARALDKDYGYGEFRILAHEVVHALFAKYVPGGTWDTAHDLEEAGAELLSLGYWAINAPPFDQRDVVSRGWTDEQGNYHTDPDKRWADPGADSMARQINYEDLVASLIRRVATKVGWNPEAIYRETQRLMRLDRFDRHEWWRDTPEASPPSGVSTRGKDLAAWYATAFRHHTLASKTAALPSGFTIEVGEEVRQPNNYTKVRITVKKDGEMAGYLHVWKHDRFPGDNSPAARNDRAFHVEVIGVDPQYQRRGIATAMYEELHRRYPGVPVVHSIGDAQSQDARNLNETLRQRFGPRMHLGSAQTPTLYRGVKVTLPEGLRKTIDGLMEPPMEEEHIDRHKKVGALIIAWLQANHWDTGVGLGRHWTTRRDMAYGAAMQGGIGNLGIILVGNAPLSSVDPNFTNTTRFAAEQEDEITLLPGAEVTITDVQLPWSMGRKDGLIEAPIRAQACEGPLGAWQNESVSLR